MACNDVGVRKLRLRRKHESWIVVVLRKVFGKLNFIGELIAS